MDVLSRKCRLGFLRRKSSEAVAAAFEAILDAGASPSYVVTDRSCPWIRSSSVSHRRIFRGTEFLGRAFQRVLERRSIHHYFANPPFKAAMA